ncbi:hypothetical protein GE21DRAFT_1288102 [Neurospora crassa]|nr:hypothetical protein GE21DRAFT_1288102 [Neurospora crassa]
MPFSILLRSFPLLPPSISGQALPQICPSIQLAPAPAAPPSTRDADSSDGHLSFYHVVRWRKVATQKRLDFAVRSLACSSSFDCRRAALNCARPPRQFQFRSSQGWTRG